MTDVPANERGWGPGWPNCQTSKWKTYRILGENITLRPEVEPIFNYLFHRFDYEVEKIAGKQLDDWGASCRPIRDSNPPVASNHSWAIAADINSLKHPLGVRGTFTAPQVLAIHLIVAEIPFLRWGGDYTHRADEQHWEWMGTPADAKATVARINKLLPWEPFAGQPLGMGRGGHQGNLVRSRLGQRQTLTGRLDRTSIALLRSFQSQRHLPVTGYVDAKCWSRLAWRLP
jgi:peptidoglycan hydrolase-like protein with peptidoglycan-binding domain